MYFLFDCYLFMYVHVFACLHEICFYYIFIFFPYLNKNLVVNEKKTQLDLIDVTLLSESNCWPLFFRSVFFYFESCTASMTPIELPPKIKIRHVSIQGREGQWGDGGGKCHIYLYLFRPVSITSSPNHCTDNETPFCSPFRNS